MASITLEVLAIVCCKLTGWVLHGVDGQLPYFAKTIPDVIECAKEIVELGRHDLLPSLHLIFTGQGRILLNTEVELEFGQTPAGSQPEGRDCKVTPAARVNGGMLSNA